MKKIISILMLLVLLQPVFSSTDVTLMYSDGCPHCATLDEYLESVSIEYDLNIIKINAATQSTQAIDIMQQYNVPTTHWSAVPKMFVGDQYCLGDTPCIELIDDYFSGNTNQTNNQTNDKPNNEKLTFAWISGLALVDAINPCALAVLTLLLTTILLRDPKQKKKALMSGIAFSLSILVCYFTMGSLLIFGFKQVSGLSSLSRPIFYKILGGFAIIMGLFNMKDFIKYGAGG